MPAPHLIKFIEEQRLPAAYLSWADTHFSTLLLDIVTRHNHKNPLTVGINGSQGSGKSTLASYLHTRLQHEHQLNCIVLSLDDFYLSKKLRQQLAIDIHPLLATRGVPGTHDIKLALDIFTALATGQEWSLPRFNKATDDLLDKTSWPIISQPPQIIIFEGWCLGAAAQSNTELTTPCNTLEAEQDHLGIWRRYVNNCLKTSYRDLFNCIDCWTMLKAPSFDTVFEWRLEQEKKLAEKLQKTLGKQHLGQHQGLMNTTDIAEFIQHYQRLTEHMLVEMPARVHHLYQLDEQRAITHEKHRDFL